MKWDDIMPDNTPPIDIKEYTDKLKQLAKKSARLARPYGIKLEAFKMNVLAQFQELLAEKNFVIEVKNPKEITAKTSKVTLTLWEEQEEDDHLILNFVTPDGSYWGFGFYFDTTNPNFGKLVENSGWYINNKEELATEKKVEHSIEYYKKQVEIVENLVLEKELLSASIDSMTFTIDLWQSNKKLGDFDSFEKALNKAVELS